jgi:hypothetical protein
MNKGIKTAAYNVFVPLVSLFKKNISRKVSKMAATKFPITADYFTFNQLGDYFYRIDRNSVPA